MASQIEHKAVNAQGNSLHSVHSAGNTAVYDVPRGVIQRPLLSELDESKVQSIMQSIQNGEDVTPIDVLWVQKPSGNYYFAMGGCHRWEAYGRLGLPTVKAKLIKTDESVIHTHLGSSMKLK